MLRAIVIDDMDNVRQATVAAIREYCPGVRIIAEADSVASGIEAVKRFIPDLVFLDVEMDDGTGFDLLQQLRPINFKVIFVTGYQEFAMKAFRFSAVDFLMKPIDPDELIEAVDKAEKTLSKELLELQFSALFSNIERPAGLKKIILRTAEKVYSVNVQDIMRCESQKNYTTFYLLNGQRLLVSTNLKEYEILLEPMGFFRSHQSHLINMMYFDHYVKSDSGMIVMKDKAQVPLATRKKEEFVALLNAL
ncbi:DNA-binding response regulator [Flavobacterium noncentrifugens]|uniref:Two component transcriptional regulator, LytTR family n=1 Tax=Flavobacterium noncentrifugens TaxID=1128970 RepID=A0A1G8ZHG6_9FLAO|nr:LytTR family DNA-binding domain-containing protein [Flavobacterium noncentrifugens]GEP51927.1 DNA-binding response regulator [Flavobacterium noncentrifugens]SDK14562.1 two component transcriptional regulator, LytTR family [Flavobacterium noncentrifugens]